MSKKLMFMAFVIGVIVGIAGFWTTITVMTSPTTQLTLDQMYKNAMSDVIFPDASRVAHNLTAIVESNTNLTWQGEGENRTVLMVTFTKYPNSYPVGGEVNMTWGETWVTVYPEMKNYFKNHVAANSNYTLRAEELLGLPANSGNTYFVEVWVKPKDLFRPTPDNEINDTTAQLTFSPNVDPAYKKWFNDNIIYSYFTKAYPWTRLGYTYDWGDPNHPFGLSEFVIKKNSIVYVKSVTYVDDYLSNMP